MSRDMAYVLDILLRAKDIVSFTKEMDRDAFLSDRKCQYAVIRCFEVIGEAAKRLSEDLQKEYPDIPWSKMARMRDLLIHAYGRVDPSEIWDTVWNDIPPLISALDRIVPPEEKP